MNNLTQKYLKSILDYNSVTGVFTWRQRPIDHFNSNHGHAVWNSRYPGTIAGTVTVFGYWQIRINGKSYRAHRLAWFYIHGEWPKDQIDHIDGNKLNNRIDNLRKANNSENNRNVGLKKSNKSGYKGVSWNNREEKWQVFIKLKGKNKNLGYFKDVIEAHKAYCKAAKFYFGEFSRTA